MSKKKEKSTDTLTDTPKKSIYTLTKSLTTKAGIKDRGDEIKHEHLDEKSWKVWLEKGVIVKQ